MFNMAKHNCATCERYDECPIKDTVDYFKNRRGELERVVKELGELFLEVASGNSFQEALADDPVNAMIYLMTLGYAHAKKEDSCQALEKSLGGGN